MTLGPMEDSAHPTPLDCPRTLDGNTPPEPIWPLVRSHWKTRSLRPMLIPCTIPRGSCFALLSKNRERASEPTVFPATQKCVSRVTHVLLWSNSGNHWCLRERSERGLFWSSKTTTINKPATESSRPSRTSRGFARRRGGTPRPRSLPRRPGSPGARTPARRLPRRLCSSRSGGVGRPRRPRS